ncbi:MAG: hypothetical protein R3E31_12975 [Chloroflexota bacterium]
MANGGQGETAVHAQAQLPNGVLSFSPTAVTLSVPQGDQAEPTQVRLHFAGANPTPEINLAQQLPGVVNYIIGDDPTQWKTQLPTYGSLVYRQLYNGIDLHYEGDMRALKGTYHVAPGVDTAVIRWSYDGIAHRSILAAAICFSHCPARQTQSQSPSSKKRPSPGRSSTGSALR